MSIDKYRHEVPLKPGVLEFLKYCKENGIRTGIGTSNGSEIVDAVLTSLNVKEYFDAVVTASFFHICPTYREKIMYHMLCPYSFYR